MPVSLGRTLRRLAVFGHAESAAYIRIVFQDARKTAQATAQKPAKKHRRSKARRKGTEVK